MTDGPASGQNASVADIYLYADETGNLDYDADGKKGATDYFGFGTAVYEGDHGDALMEGLRLRASVEHGGVSLERGFHAKDDSWKTRGEMFDVIAAQAPRFDTTFLLKANAYDRIREAGEMRLYKMAWYLHFKEVALQVSSKDDTLWAIVGTFGTKARARQARHALSDVCDQVRHDVRLCVWPSRSSWGLQVADYALWATHRNLTGQPCESFASAIEPSTVTRFTPWGELPVTPPLIQTR